MKPKYQRILSSFTRMVRKLESEAERLEREAEAKRAEASRLVVSQASSSEAAKNLTLAGRIHKLTEVDDE